jgi:hypothetical protein
VVRAVLHRLLHLPLKRLDQQVDLGDAAFGRGLLGLQVGKLALGLGLLAWLIISPNLGK